MVPPIPPDTAVPFDHRGPGGGRKGGVVGYIARREMVGGADDVIVKEEEV